MPVSDDKIQVTTVLERKLDERISNLADRMGVSKSSMIAMLLDAAIEENERIIQIVTSRFAKRLASAFGLKPKAAGKGKEVEGG